ncbi:MAG: ferrous iron transport protein A [Methanomicrobia archaeon]|nr:ferrous iron transport protein A [Methanomicrobia archaeon]
MFTLRDLKIGQVACVVKVHGEGPIKRRLMDMGICRGACLKIIKVAPLGDPIEISVRGYELSLRKSDASSIEVEVQDTSVSATK